VFETRVEAPSILALMVIWLSVVPQIVGSPSQEISNKKISQKKRNSIFMILIYLICKYFQLFIETVSDKLNTINKIACMSYSFDCK
jgi:hypothetical protein